MTAPDQERMQRILESGSTPADRPLATATRSPGQSSALNATDPPEAGGTVVVVVVLAGAGGAAVLGEPLQVSSAARNAEISASSAVRSQRTFTVTQSVAY